MPFLQAPAGARRILGVWRRSGWLWCCGRSCWGCKSQGISETYSEWRIRNFINGHMEAAAECIPTKPTSNHRVLWKTLAVRKRRDNVKKVSLNANAKKLKKAKRELTHTKKNKQKNIQGHIKKIRYSVEDRQSRITWQTVNEVSQRKSLLRAKIKAAGLLEQIQM